MAWKRASTSKRTWGKKSQGSSRGSQPSTVHSKGWHQTGGLLHKKGV